LAGHTGPVVSALFSPDGTYLLSADESTIRLWSGAGSNLGKLIRAIGVPFSSKIQSVSFSPLGQFLVVNQNPHHYTRVLDLSTGREVAIIPPKYQDRYACFSSNEHLMLFFGNLHDNNLHLCQWDAESCYIKKVLKGHTNTVLRASFSPDGKHIVSASKDFTIRVWSAETGSQTAVYQNLGLSCNPDNLRTIEISPDGRHILTVYNESGAESYANHVQIWAMPDSLPTGTDLNYSADNPNVCI